MRYSQWVDLVLRKAKEGRRVAALLDARLNPFRDTAWPSDRKSEKEPVMHLHPVCPPQATQAWALLPVLHVDEPWSQPFACLQ